MQINKIIKGNCLDELKKINSSQINLVYFDPPFFTQKKHSLTSRDSSVKFEFNDKFNSLKEYLFLIENVLLQSKRVLKETGSVFLHCDKTASHRIRLLLDKVFGENNFQSEIIWTYKRWSNSKKGLLNSHQVIFFYSKTSEFKFNPVYTDYSPTTNLDQILQDRVRNKSGKSVYKKDNNGRVLLGGAKKGVPLSDVWEIPYLNPKANERSGYPTQKPILLLNRIVSIVTDAGDTVLDPFCGSGTTCVSAKLLKRKFIGIDISEEAVDLANKRLKEMIITNSHLLEKGMEDYLEKSESDLAILNSLSAFPVQRNAGIDGFRKEHFQNNPVPIKIQADNETLEESIEKLEKACKGKDYKLKLVIQTSETESVMLFKIISNVKIIKSLQHQVKKSTSEMIIIENRKFNMGKAS